MRGRGGCSRASAERCACLGASKARSGAAEAIFSACVVRRCRPLEVPPQLTLDFHTQVCHQNEHCTPLRARTAPTPLSGTCTGLPLLAASGANQVWEACGATLCTPWARPPHTSSFALCHTELRGAGCAVDQPWPAAPPPNASRRSCRTSRRTPHPPAAQGRSVMTSSTGSQRSWGRCAPPAAVAAPHPYRIGPFPPPPAPHTARVLPRRLPPPPRRRRLRRRCLSPFPSPAPPPSPSPSPPSSP